MLIRERIGICTLYAPYASDSTAQPTCFMTRKLLQHKEKVWSRRADSNR